MREAVTGDVRHVYGIACLLKALGQREKLNRAALQSVYQQYGVFAATECDGVHESVWIMRRAAF
jgi:hypothetical protein